MNRSTPDFVAGQGLLNAGRPDLAESYVRRGLSVEPGSAIGHAWLAQCLVARKAIAEARAEAGTSISLAPESPAGHAVLGAVEAAAGRWRQAEASSREAVRLDPLRAGHHTALGHALLQQGRPGRALAAAREALRLQPDSADALNILALALADLGRVAEARDTLHSALVSRPESAVLHSNLAFVLIGQGEPAAAREMALEALRLEPSLEVAQRNLRVSERIAARPLGFILARTATWWRRRPVWERAIFILGLAALSPIAPVTGVMALLISGWWAYQVIVRWVNSPARYGSPEARIISSVAAASWVVFFFGVSLVPSLYVGALSGVGAIASCSALALAASSRRPYRQIAFGFALVAIVAGTIRTNYDIPGSDRAPVALSDAQIHDCLFPASADVDREAAKVGIDLASIRSAILSENPIPTWPVSANDPIALQEWVAAGMASARRSRIFLEGCSAALAALPPAPDTVTIVYFVDGTAPADITYVDENGTTRTQAAVSLPLTSQAGSSGLTFHMRHGAPVSITAQSESALGQVSCTITANGLAVVDMGHATGQSAAASCAGVAP